MPFKRTIPRVCKQCRTPFLARTGDVNAGVALFCGRPCYTAYRREHPAQSFDRAAWLAAAKARNRAFVDEINVRTVCAHCGAQPIEWHNPEHVELNRQGFRISTMVTAGSSIAAIQAEMDRCTPLCRRCHMAEDGRLAELRKNARLADARRSENGRRSS